MKYWLFKSEPDAWSWDMQVAKGEVGEPWSGVRNYTARNNMREMKLGDRAFFYHSNEGLEIVSAHTSTTPTISSPSFDRAFFYHSNEGLEIVGVVEVCALSAPDPATDDPRWDCVTVRALAPMPKPVSLKDVKANPKLKEMSLVASFRLSVQPVLLREWNEVCRMGGMDPKTLKPV